MSESGDVGNPQAGRVDLDIILGNRRGGLQGDLEIVGNGRERRFLLWRLSDQKKQPPGTPRAIFWGGGRMPEASGRGREERPGPRGERQLLNITERSGIDQR